MTHPFIIGAIEPTDITSMKVMLKHADYARFSYTMELSFDSMRAIDGGMPAALVESETRMLVARMTKWKIACAQEEVAFAVIASMTRLVKAYRAMLPPDKPSWQAGTMSDPRVCPATRKAG